MPRGDIRVAYQPHPLKAIQVDGDSEFEAIFEAECQKSGINLFVLPAHPSSMVLLSGLTGLIPRNSMK